MVFDLVFLNVQVEDFEQFVEELLEAVQADVIARSSRVFQILQTLEQNV